jgi:hypothetical protein
MKHRINGKSVMVEIGSGRGVHIFYGTSDLEVTEDEASKIQKIEGYDACGYGFYGFRSNISEDGVLWECSWECFNTCD